MDPSDTSSELNSTAFQTEQMSRRLRTLVPVRVVKVYKQDGKTAATRGEVAGAGYVDVQPMVSQVDGAGQRMDHATVYHVPYTRTYGGDFAVICDPVKDDVGWMSCADRDASVFVDKVRQGTTQPVLPGSRRTHDMSDGMYVGGVLNNAPKQYVTVTDKGITIVDVNSNTITLNNTGITIKAKSGAMVVLDGSGNVQVIPTGTVFLGGTGTDGTYDTVKTVSSSAMNTKARIS